MPIAIVTDSTCGLTRGEARDLGVTVLPMAYQACGERRQEMPQGENGGYDALLRQDPFASTEGIYSRAFRAAFRRLVEDGSDVVCVTMSGRLASAFRVAEEARLTLDDHHPDLCALDHVRVVDSLSTVAGLEAVVRQARVLADQGLSLEEVARGCEDYRLRVQVRFAVSTMQPLTRSGRLGATRRSVQAVAGSYPVFALRQGAIETVGLARGQRGTARRLVADVPRGARLVTIDRFGEADGLARPVVLELRRQAPEAKVLVKDGGPVIAARIGVGSVSLTWVGDD